MIAVGEDELICDMAEVYGILSCDTLPVLLYATLASGLRKNSRIREKMDGYDVTTESLLLSVIFDKLTYAFWSGEGEKPKSLTSYLLGEQQSAERTNKRNKIYDSPEDFEREWEEG